MMFIDAQKPYRLLSTLAVIAMAGAACSSPEASSTPTPTRRLVQPSSTVVPTPDITRTPLQLYPEFLVPRHLKSGAEFVASSYGIVANLTGGITLKVDADNLSYINRTRLFGINLKPNQQNMVYLFPGNFTQGRGLADAKQLIAGELPFAMVAISQVSGVIGGELRFTPISVADVIRRVAAENSKLRPGSNAFLRAVNEELSAAYVGTARLDIASIDSVTPTYPAIEPEPRARLSSRLPLSIVAIDQRYLSSLGIGPVN